MTFLFDPAKAMATLSELEKTWGGTPTERMNAKYRAFVSRYGTSAPRVGDDEAVAKTMDAAENTQPPSDGASNETGPTRPEEPPAQAAPEAEPAPTPSPAAPTGAPPAPGAAP